MPHSVRLRKKITRANRNLNKRVKNLRKVAIKHSGDETIKALMADIRVNPPKYKNLQCFANGFTWSKHARADTATVVHALRIGDAPETAGISKSKAQQMKKRWWEAQVRLYGLQCTDFSENGCREVLVKALAKGPLEVRKDIKDAEVRLKMEYHKRIAEKKDRRLQLNQEMDMKYLAATTDESKAALKPERFLREKFTVEKVEFVVLRRMEGYYAGLESAIKTLALRRRRTEEVPGYHCKIYVIAKDVEIVNREIQRLDKEVAEEKAEIDKGICEEFDKARQKLLKDSSDGGSPSGRWSLCIPEYSAKCLDGVRHDELHPCTLNIPPYVKGMDGVYAKFSFVFLNGYFKVNLGESKGSWEGVEMKFNWEGYEEREEFDIHAKNIGSITFTSASECHGTVEGWIGGPFHFKGFKFSLQLPPFVTESTCKEEYEKQKAYADGVREYDDGEGIW